uniref:Reverse transcriptase domain-containing protein n=1 Tax=Anguilla anguilla TaxID=7936 RepID=A0A0E9SGP1_ANGAN
MTRRKLLFKYDFQKAFDKVPHERLVIEMKTI